MKKTKEMNKKTAKAGINPTSNIPLHTSKNGITLIALVITIIVMLILVSVTISMAVNGGLFDYAGKATGDTKNAIEAEKDLSKGGLKVGNTYYDSIDDYLSGIESVKSLQENHEFTYYSSLKKAVDDVNNNTRDNADSDKEEAVAGVYTENGKHFVVLLKDITEETRVQPSVDVTINLGGHTLSTKDIVCIDVISCNVTIDGRLRGSSIEMTSTEGKPARPLQNMTGNLVVNGGTYIGNTINGPSVGSVIHSEAALTVTDVKIIANDNTTGTAKGITVGNGGSSTITNCNITTTSNSGNAISIHNSSGCEMVVFNSEIKAFANFKRGGSEHSEGVGNYGTITINNSYVMGTRAGISNRGILKVNGGTYEGVAGGGIIFENGTKDTYIRNAVLRECSMPEGYTTETERGIAFRIGVNLSSNNIKVYMDNCDIYGSVNPLLLYGENNTLYISNSRINTDKQIDIGNDTHKLYIGKGCNFTAENTNLPSAVVKTEEVYVQD